MLKWEEIETGLHIGSIILIGLLFSFALFFGLGFLLNPEACLKAGLSAFGIFFPAIIIFAIVSVFIYGSLTGVAYLLRGYANWRSKGRNQS